MNYNSRFFLAFLAGSVAGLALATLFAPRSGSELREGISDKFSELKDSVERNLREKKARLDTIASNVKATAGEISHDLQVTVDHGKTIAS